MLETDDRIANTDYSAREEIDLRGLIRLACWGAMATSALLLAVFASRSDLGSRRMAAIFGPATATQTTQLPPAPSPAAARAAELEFETRQMAVAVRSLSADRDRLLARVTVLERNLDDVTGSISRAATKPAPQPESLPQIDRAPAPEMAKQTPETPNKTSVAIGPSLVATISSPITIPTPSPETLARVGLSSIPTVDDDSVERRTDFGVDIGNGPTVASLRIAWTAIRRSHAELFEGLHPVIAVRDGSKSGTIELRLVVGPLSNAAAAARLCGRVANAGLSCRPVIFDGQRLALR